MDLGTEKVELGSRGGRAELGAIRRAEGGNKPCRSP